MTQHRARTLLSILAILLLATVAVAGCGGSKSSEAASIPMADASDMPAQVQSAPQRVVEAYRFAAANPDVLHRIPCYCGCGAMGHQSNYNCFWQDDGTVDTHALGCGICVDIAQDTLRGLQQSQPLTAIRAQIDADYSRFGPPTDTAPVRS